MDVPSLIASSSAAYTVVKDLIGALLNERDREKAAAIKLDLFEKLAEAQAQLLQVQSGALALQGQVFTLQERNRQLEAARSEKERYELAKIGTEGEFFAYRLRSVAELDKGAGEVAHLLCQPCFDTGKKYVLAGNGDGHWGCPVCKHGAQTTETSFIPSATTYVGSAKLRVF